MEEQTPATDAAPKKTGQRSKRNTLIGLIALLGPIISVVVIFILFAVVSFIFGAVVTSDGAQVIGALLSFVLSALSIVAILAIPVGLVVGIIYLGKKD